MRAEVEPFDCAWKMSSIWLRLYRSNFSRANPQAWEAKPFLHVPPPPPPPSRLAPLVFLSPSIFQTVHKTVIRNVSTSVYAPRVSLVKLIKDRSRKPCYAVVTYCCRDLRLRNCTTISRLILYNSQLKLIINVELILMRKYLKIDFKIEY